MNLTNTQKKYLKALAHHKKTVVTLGNNSLTEGVLFEIENALNYHELIKVKIAATDRDAKHLIIQAIVRETKAYFVQNIGNILTLYRPTNEKKIQLPK